MNILQVAVVIVTMSAAVVLLRVSLRMLLSGAPDIREMRQDGGGIAAFFRGKLEHGHGGPRVYQGHGLHICVSKDGEMKHELKSKVV